MSKDISVETPDPCWAYFDRFYCISIDERADRRAEARIQFAKVGLADRIEFVRVRKHPHNCEQGIYESHMSCIRKGLKAGAASMVIFEDDIHFERFNVNGLKACVEFLSGTKNWNALFFGCLVSASRKTQNKSVLKIKYRCLAHAYALNRRFAESLINTRWQGTPFDEILRNRRDYYYAAYPSFAFQSNSRTDNDRNMGLDKFRRVFGGLKRIQKWNEFIHRHKFAVIAVHVIVMVIIFIMVFAYL